jgi:RecA/RadA recombinase
MAKKKAEEFKEMVRQVGKVATSNDVWFSTGSALIDEVAGGDKGEGFEAGGIVNIVGQSGSGKSFLCIETLANAIHRYGDNLKYCYVDNEGGAGFSTQDLYGFTVPPENAPVIKTVEDFHANAMNFIDSMKPGEVGLYVVDSWDGLTGAEVVERSDERKNAYARDKEFTDGSFLGGKNKFASTELFPTLVSAIQNKPILFLISNQVRENVGAGLYAPKFKVTGGNALLFYCSTRLWIKPVEKHEIQGRATGVTVHVEAKKSRNNRPYRQCYTTLWFTYGIDNVGSCVDYLYSLRSKETGKLLSAAQKPMTWDGITLENREAMILHVENNNLESELFKRTRDAWEAIETEIVGSLAMRKKRFS